MNTHIGKIGRLPRDTRHLLGQRIENGIPNKELVQWLNASPNVKDLLALRFGGRAITEQNLSEWKQTGHVEWLRREERRGLALQWLEQRDEEAMDPEESAAEKAVSDRLGRELGLEMAGLALAMVEQAGSMEERWERLCKIYKEVCSCGGMISGRRRSGSSGNDGNGSRPKKKQGRNGRRRKRRNGRC